MSYTFEQLLQLAVGAPVLNSLETSNRHIGLVRLEPPREALVSEVFLFSQVGASETYRPLIHYAFLVVNCQAVGRYENIWSICSVLDRTKLYNISIPSGFSNVRENSFLVVNQAGVVVASYLSARSFQREWPVLAMKLA